MAPALFSFALLTVTQAWGVGGGPSFAFQPLGSYFWQIEMAAQGILPAWNLPGFNLLIGFPGMKPERAHLAAAGEDGSQGRSRDIPVVQSHDLV